MTMKFLKIYAFITTSIILGLTIVGFTQIKNKKFKTITVERIDIVEPDGKKEMVISNAHKMPDVVLKDGTVLRERGDKKGGAAGILFYNYLEEEAGGLTYSSLSGKDDKGKKAYRAGAGLTFDQFRSDQVVDLGYNDDGDTREAGLTVVDRPTEFTNEDMYKIQKQIKNANSNKERKRLLNKFDAMKASGKLGAYRVFVGSDRKQDAVVRLFDKKSNPRLLMKVDSKGNPSIQFLDEKGKVVRKIGVE